MNKIVLFYLIFVGLSFCSYAQIIKVQPYLQDAEPNSIFILWETDQGEESTVEWGLTNALGNTSSGSFVQTFGTSILHEVGLTGLNRFTPYFYRVKTGNTYSEIYKFKTPPFSSDNESFRLIAMSDMQRDYNNPNIFEEIINEGIIPYLENEAGGELTDNLAFVMIPGDIVDNGNDYSQWEEQFFSPSKNLVNQVPVYPVLGNHEQNSEYYFKYFKLPDNGTVDFEEHWWYKDYGNLRIIGLDSNSPYTNQDQLDWLDDVLSNSCSDSSINFVFAQLHHPFKSELWIPGELNYTGEVISRLENFSTDCNKPSIHFFGHTHGYSRGQSLDHKHLWINVATAGGAIDYWGDYPQVDYDEFSKSQDEWGFVSVNIINDNDPRFVVKRISKGNENVFRDNEVTDSLVVRLNSTALIETPTVLFPINEEVIPECVILKATNFNSTDPNAFHGQSHWQIATDCDFENPVAESWKNFENFYFEINTQENDDLTDEKFETLFENTLYCWRVRYRDRELNWSDWSSPTEFTTGDSTLSNNLLINPEAENELENWTIIEGYVEALTDGECDGISPQSGNRYFAVGGLCQESPFGKCIQNIDVSSYDNQIDTGTFQVYFGGYLSNYNGNDLPEMRLIFLDNNGNELDVSNTISSLQNSWIFYSDSIFIPEQTRTIKFELTGTRNAGSDNDSYFDNLFLKVGESVEECSQLLTIQETNNSLPTLKVVPNPWSKTTSIVVNENSILDINIQITNVLGQQVFCPATFKNNKIVLERGTLKKGVYFFKVISGNSYVGVGKFIVK